MYTFNRNKESTSLSQFMATGQKILEEEDCDSESQDNETMKGCDVRQSLESESGMDMPGQPSKMNEDENFMFDMEEKKGKLFKHSITLYTGPELVRLKRINLRKNKLKS